MSTPIPAPLSGHAPKWGLLIAVGVYHLVMGVYLAAWLLEFGGTPQCLSIDTRCPGGVDTFLLDPGVVRLDLLLVLVNVVAGVLLITRERRVLLPVLALQCVDAASLFVGGNAVALVLTLGVVLPAGWLATVTAVVVQLRSSGRQRQPEST